MGQTEKIMEIRNVEADGFYTQPAAALSVSDKQGPRSAQGACGKHEDRLKAMQLAPRTLVVERDQRMPCPQDLSWRSGSSGLCPRLQLTLACILPACPAGV